MSNQHFELTYGRQVCSFQIPAERLSGPLIAPRKSEPLPGTALEILRESLANPIDRPPLRELSRQKRVGIVISDEFRAGLQHEILDALLDEVLAGDPVEVVVLCATGTHQPDVYARNAAAWVRAARERHQRAIGFEANDSENSTFVELGLTRRSTPVRINSKLLDCNLRVHGHESKHHYLNGYSCIDKQVVPGLACTQTVEANHKLALMPDSGPGRNAWHHLAHRQANPFSEDSREARQISEQFMLSPSGRPVRAEVDTFALDMVSANNSIYWVRSGDPGAITREMIRVVDDLMAFEVKPSRYVVISPGGPPASNALYGTQNCFDLGLKGAILPGGEALVIAPLEGRADLPEDVRGLAPDRRSKELFWDNLVRLRNLPLSQARQEIADRFELYLWKTDRVLRLMNGDGVGMWLHSQLSARLVESGGFHATTDVQAWIDERLVRDDGDFTVIDHGNKLCVTRAE